jgi:hypothetical protein
MGSAYKVSLVSGEAARRCLQHSTVAIVGSWQHGGMTYSVRHCTRSRTVMMCGFITQERYRSGGLEVSVCGPRPPWGSPALTYTVHLRPGWTPQHVSRAFFRGWKKLRERMTAWPVVGKVWHLVGVRPLTDRQLQRIAEESLRIGTDEYDSMTQGQAESWLAVLPEILDS